MPTHTIQDEVALSADMMPEQFREQRTEYWRFIDVSKLPKASDKLVAHRLNSLGSLFYFIKVPLRRRRLQEHLHGILCSLLESTHLKEVIEWPRDHFKSTIGSEGAPMWWALPFTNEDEDWMRKLGYGEEWIRWMKRAHDQNTRTLLTSENITNAKKLGFRIDQHYQSNDFFRELFKEVLPNEKCKWTEESMHHLRTKDTGPQGEGTYDFLGVGGALQSRHYDRIVMDDLVGRKALDSETVMNTTIEYFKLVVGAMDSSEVNADIDNDEVVIGNRWSSLDLNAWIKTNLPYYRQTNHSAEGGCCPQHPVGHPIFPEEFTMGKLLRWKMRLGTYLYSCQFLNNPLIPGSTRWATSNLNFYHYDLVNYAKKYDASKNAYELVDNRVKIVHETKLGLTPHSIMPRELTSIKMLIDPNHAGNEGRCRHAIIIVGSLHEKIATDNGYEHRKRVYLLDTWAESTGYTEFCNKIVEMILKWKLQNSKDKVYCETVAAQKYLKHHLEFLFRTKNISCKINELKEDKKANAKARRIESLDPLFESGQFYVKREDPFVKEYEKYPRGTTIDILDLMGYYLQLPDETTSEKDIKDFIQKANATNPFRPQAKTERNSRTGY